MSEHLRQQSCGRAGYRLRWAPTKMCQQCVTVSPESWQVLFQVLSLFYLLFNYIVPDFWQNSGIILALVLKNCKHPVLVFSIFTFVTLWCPLVGVSPSSGWEPAYPFPQISTLNVVHSYCTLKLRSSPASEGSHYWCTHPKHFPHTTTPNPSQHACITRLDAKHILNPPCEGERK